MTFSGYFVYWDKEQMMLVLLLFLQETIELKMISPYVQIVRVCFLGQGLKYTSVSTSPMSDLVVHRALSARRATSSNVASPVSRLSVANSRMNVPTPAVQVTGVSVGLTPCSRLTVP